MVWRNKHRAGRKKRERIATLTKGPTITSVEAGRYISDKKRGNNYVEMRGEPDTPTVQSMIISKQ